MHTDHFYIQIKHLQKYPKYTVVNKIKSTDAISLKLLYVCSQFNTIKHGKFQTNRLINFVAMTIV